MLKGGIVQQVATPEEIYDAPANTFVADFMGSPPMNLVPAHVEAGGEGGTLLFADGQRLAVALPPRVRELESVTVGIRPEAFSRHASGGSSLAIEPTMIENSGADAFVNFALGERTLTARLAGTVRRDDRRDVRAVGRHREPLLFRERERRADPLNGPVIAGACRRGRDGSVPTSFPHLDAHQTTATSRLVLTRL